jgi:hypothetical protein
LNKPPYYVILFLHYIKGEKVKKLALFVVLAFIFCSCGSGAIKKDNNNAADAQQFDKLMAENAAKQTVSPAATAPAATATAVPANAEAATAANKVTPGQTESPTVKPQYPEDARYYPERLGNTWYFQGYTKKEPNRLLKVKAEILSEEKEDGQIYYYIHAPKMGIRYVNKRKDDAVYMRIIKYPFPIFGFPIEVNLIPEMPVMKYPIKAGAKWIHKAKARVVIIFPLERDIQSDFEIIGKETVNVPAGTIEAWHIKVLVNQGDGTVTTEEYWYGKDFGYCKANTTGHYAELVGYRMFNEKTGKWMEKIPLDADQYK